MAESGDFVMIFPSEVIARVMESYFNDKMLKFPVTVVDVSAKDENFVFSLGYKEIEKIENGQFVEELRERELSELGVIKPKSTKKR